MASRQPRGRRRGVPRLLAITDLDARRRAGEGDAELGQWIRDLAEAGVDALQVRQKGAPPESVGNSDDRLSSGPKRDHPTSPSAWPSDRRILDDLGLAVDAARGRLTILVNGRPDLAAAAGADGVHLPSRGLPIAKVRQRWPDLLIGISTHHPEKIGLARQAGADYATFGPVFPTPSKAAYGEPPGVAGLIQAVAQGLPVLALGGINLPRLAQVATHGAHGIAAIRAFQPGPGLVEMARGARLHWPACQP